MELKTFYHILNPNSKNTSAVRKYFKKHPHLHHQWVDRSSHPTHLETIVEWAVLEKQSNLAIWSGDGTLSRVLQKLYELDALDKINLCLIPTGTCNDFARHMSILPWKSWLKTIEKKDVSFSQCDLGLIDYGQGIRTFLNNAGFGRSREAVQSKKSNPIQDIKSFVPHRLQIEWGNEKINQFETTSALLLMIFNGPFFSKGLHFFNKISAQDGLLHGVVVPPQGGLQIGMKFIKARFGASLSGANDMTFSAQFVNVDSEEWMYPQADGETLSRDGTKSLKVKVLEKAFKLLSPIIKENSHGADS